MFGSTLGLLRRPAAWLASCVALIGLSLFFHLIYRGYYRHEALWLVFMLSMYWIAGQCQETDQADSSVRTTVLARTLQPLGIALFIVILAVQDAAGVAKGFLTARNNPPASRSRDLGALISKRPELREAIIIADPDYLVEPLPYYIPNRTYLMRERRFGNRAVFTRQARLQLSLDDILAQARELRAETSKPVIILLWHRLDSSLPKQTVKEGYNWELLTTPEQVRTFQAATQLLESFAPVGGSEESYDVYLLN
jgi:hypothetical protein